MNTYANNINKLTHQYNDAIRALEDAYQMESTQGYDWNVTSSHLRRQYSKQYEALAREYKVKCQQLLSAYQQAHPEWARWRRIWARVFVIGIIAMMTCCGASLAADDAASTNALYDQQQALGASSDEIYWNADNIPIPYLQDSTQYVSNPDSVLTPMAVLRMNQALQRLRLELGIQSVFIVVNHIENDDPFRMAQDVGNRYGVGYNDRGLVVVVGYEDHSINMSPGRSLEADLTDAECHRLEQQYVIPAMRAEMPDSGMIYLAEALLAKMQQKELPQMSPLLGQQADEDDATETAIGLSFLFLIVWSVVFLRLNKKYQWLALVGSTALIPNPFYVSEGSHFSGGGGFGGFSGGGGGGFSGGSFGGGSFGGGGATSRW